MLVLLGVEDREDKVLQLGLERLYAEPFGERDQHIAGDLRDPRLFLGAHHPEGPHVVQPVGELDRHHPDVVPGGDEHLPECLGLGRRTVVDLLEFGDAVDEVADLFAELLPHLIKGYVGVLDGVMEEGRGERRRLGAEFGEDQRDRERVRDVRLTALAHLPPVGGFCQDVGLVQDGQVGVRMMGPVGLGDMADRIGQPVAGDGSEQGDPAESAKIDPGTASSADGSTWVGGLCAHGGTSGKRRPAVGRCGRASGPVLDATDPTTWRSPALAQRETDHPFERSFSRSPFRARPDRSCLRRR